MNSSSSMKSIVNVSRGFCESRRRVFSRIFSLNYTLHETGERARKGEDDERGKGGVGEKTEKGSVDEVKKKASKEAGGKPVDEDKGMDVNWRPIAEDKPSDQSSS